MLRWGNNGRWQNGEQVNTEYTGRVIGNVTSLTEMP